MSEKRILRDRTVVSKKFAKVLNTRHVLKRKSNEKENFLSHRSFKEDHDSISDKEDQSQRHLFNSRYKRGVTKQNATSKVKLRPIKNSNSFNEVINHTKYLKKKDSVVLNIHNQKQNFSEQNSFKVKVYKQPFNKNIECKKNPIENIYSEKIIATKKESTEITLNSKKVPIWKQNLSMLKSCEKRRYVDVYDITLDEELAASKAQIKKEKICSKKKTKKVKCEKKKHLMSVTEKSCISKPIHVKPVSKKNKTSAKKLFFPADKLVISQTVLSKQNTYDTKVCVEQSDKQNTYDTEVYVEQNDEENAYDTEVCVEQNDRQNFCISSPNDTSETIQCILTDLQTSKSQDQSKTYLSNLADELEKSFSVPKMTSTPDDIHSKTKVQMKKNKIINTADISNILATNKNCLNSSLASPIFSNNASPQTDKDIGEITLFESPKRLETKEQNGKVAPTSPQKKIQINLFGEVLRTPSSIESSEDSVLMPKKAYHTPDNFKRHLIRTKKPVEKIREPTMTKQDLLIEKMSQHFDEISKTELCIE